MQTKPSKAQTAARIVHGGAFLLFGLNGFFQFLPQPPAPEPAQQFLGALAATGYMFPLIKGTEVAVGALLLSNRFVPLSLVLIAPVLVNILAFHAFLAPAGLALPMVLLATELVLAWGYRDAFRPLLRAIASPAMPRDEPEHAGSSTRAAA
jgi:hypothetical protein